jgi:hypothetical protein
MHSLYQCRFKRFKICAPSVATDNAFVFCLRAAPSCDVIIDHLTFRLFCHTLAKVQKLKAKVILFVNDTKFNSKQ